MYNEVKQELLVPTVKVESSTKFASNEEREKRRKEILDARKLQQKRSE